MARTAMIRARVELRAEREAEAGFEETGLLVSEACELFHREAVMRRRLRFAAGIPNRETRAAVRRVRARKGLIKYDSLEDFRKEMNSA